MERIDEREVELTPLEVMIQREFNERLDRGESVAGAVRSIYDDLDEIVVDSVDREFWCWLADVDEIYPTSGYVGVVPRATDWFWHSSGGGMWVAVVGEHEIEKWWDGGKPPPEAPEQWRRPIYLWPESGVLHWRDKNGDLRSEEMP